MSKNIDRNALEIIRAVASHNRRAKHALKIVFIHSCSVLPNYCIPEEFSPRPLVGFFADSRLHLHLSDEYNKNPTIHDGALAFMPAEADGGLVLSAWGVRLFPPVLSSNRGRNKGMAYNSSLQFSAVSAVERVILFGSTEATLFKGGKELSSIPF